MEPPGARKAGAINLGTAYYEDKFVGPETSSSISATGREQRRWINRFGSKFNVQSSMRLTGNFNFER